MTEEQKEIKTEEVKVIPGYLKVVYTVTSAAGSLLNVERQYTLDNEELKAKAKEDPNNLTGVIIEDLLKQPFHAKDKTALKLGPQSEVRITVKELTMVDEPK